jgi:hypothetical protein
MNGPAKKRAISLTEPLSRRAILRIVGCLVLVALLAGGAYWAYHRYSSGTLTAAEERAVIRKYLRKQTGLKEFKTTATAEVPPPAPMMTNVVTDQMITVNEVPPPNGPGPNRLGANKADPEKPGLEGPGPNGPGPKKQTRRRTVTSQPNEFTSAFRRQVNEAQSYKAIYRLIGEQLWLADQRLASADPQQRETGVLLAVEASRVALNDALNAWLASRICAGYLLPAFDMTNAPRLSMDMLLDTSEQAFRQAVEKENLIRTYKMFLSKNSRSPRADTTRTRLANLLADREQYAEALSYVREVRNTNSPVIQQRIASWENQLSQKKNARN